MNRRSQIPDEPTQPSDLRIIGGSLGGRKLLYHGDARTRPMKDRVRESVFNLLGILNGFQAIDLFAGTGALGLEALSRGAERAIFIEQHFPTAKIIRQNIAVLDLTTRCEVVPGNTFIWARKFCVAQAEQAATSTPWVVFCSPPYAFYAERQAEMLELISSLFTTSPAGSVFVVESDDPFDTNLLPAGDWDIRNYPPAKVAICHQ